MLLCSASHNMFLSHYNDSINKIVSSNCIITTKSRCDLFLNYESGIIMYHYRCLSMFGHTARMDDDADAKNDSNSSANRLLEETTRASPYHMAEHRPVQSESLQSHTERSSRPGPEPPCVEADVYVWRYALLVVHARKEEEEESLCAGIAKSVHILLLSCSRLNAALIWQQSVPHLTVSG